MTGRVTRKGNRWYVVVDLGRDTAGKRRLRWFSGYPTKRAATADRDRIVNEMRGGKFTEPSKETVGEYLEEWLAHYARQQVQATTYEGYASVIRLHLAPAFAHVRLTELTGAMIQRYYTRALAAGRIDGKGGLSPTTVLQHHRILHEALRHAVRWQRIPGNPADVAIPPPKAEFQAATLSREQSKELLALARPDCRLYLPIVLACATGMRRGEAFGLRWSDYDERSGELYIQRSLEVTTEFGLRFKTTKTEKSRRRVPLPAFAIVALAEHRDLQQRERSDFGADYQDQGLILAQPDGAPVHPDRFSKWFLNFRKSRAVPPIRFQDLRHTHATQLLVANVHPKVVSERLGHSNVNLTLNTYSHVIPTLQREASDIIGEILG